MVRFISEGACSDMQMYAEYDGPAGGDDAPNATLLVSTSLFITGLSDGADLQKDIITLKYDVATGVNDHGFYQANASVFPNPLHTVSTLSLDELSSGSSELLVKIYNVLGEVVHTATSNGSDILLDKADFNNGVYSYQVIGNGKVLANGRFVAGF